MDKDGNWIKSWGEPGDGPGQFNIPHSIATDAQGNVYVADRGNRRIQVFDGEGKFLEADHDRRTGSGGCASGNRCQANSDYGNNGTRRALGNLHYAGTTSSAV